MKQTHPIVMLPTEKASSLYLDGYNKLNLFPVLDTLNSNKQHLFVLSDEEIKDGDYVYRLYENGGSHIGKALVKSDNLKRIEDKRVFKIIATTDKSLNQLGIMCADKSKAQPCINIPQIPSTFLPIFVEAYNSGSITEVELEYEEYGEELGCDPAYFGLDSHRLKTTKSNEVIISLPEVKMYSRDEVKTLLIDLHDDLADKLASRFISLDKWIEENL